MKPIWIFAAVLLSGTHGTPIIYYLAALVRTRPHRLQWSNGVDDENLAARAKSHQIRRGLTRAGEPAMLGCSELM